ATPGQRLLHRRLRLRPVPVLPLGLPQSAAVAAHRRDRIAGRAGRDLARPLLGAAGMKEKPMTEHTADVVVVGCGVAGLSAAVAARELGAEVIVLERATYEERGGNTRYTEAFLRMKSEDEVADDFIDHLTENAGGYLDPSVINEAGRPYEQWPGLLK